MTTTRKRPFKAVMEVPDLWMICREDSTPGTYGKTSPNPKKLYETEESARYDAAQLCLSERKRFYLLKVVAVVQTSAPPVEWIE